MENASKALLIAGAILIAILLIAIGMMVFNSANSVVNTGTSSISDSDKELHNKKFTLYEGTKDGSMVLDLIHTAKVHNSNDANEDVTIKMGSTDLLSDSSSIVRAKQYTIKCPLETNGIVKNITVQAK